MRNFAFAKSMFFIYKHHRNNEEKIIMRCLRVPAFGWKRHGSDTAQHDS